MATDTMETVERVSERAGPIASDLVDNAREAAGDVARRSRATLDQVADSAADVAERVGTQVNDVVDRTLRYTSAHPLQALAVVLIAGFVVGRLSRRY